MKKITMDELQLMFTCRYEYLEIVKLILENDANI